MIKKVTSRSLLSMAVVGLVFSAAACGDDESESSTPPPAKRKQRAKKAKPPTAAGAAAEISGYSKVAPELRHEFTEMDFVPDAAGEQNRDPFRSSSFRPPLDPDEAKEEKKDVCTESNVRWAARESSFRGLKLIGLVKRGKSFAQFAESSGADSYIVRKGDCIGQEKAVIGEVGVGYVRLLITPASPPDSPTPPVQKQDIALYPEELQIGGDVLGTDSRE